MQKMNITKFLNEQALSNYGIWYFIDDKTQKKIPLRKGTFGEKNTLSRQEVSMESDKNSITFINKPTEYYNSIKKVSRPLSETELSTLTQAYTIFIKHSTDIYAPNKKLYCIDIDEPTIKSMDDFVKLTNINLFEKCIWVKGNTKGIHIYVYIENMVEYSNQQKVFLNFDGDLIHNNNMWESADKKVY
jgi:hypothetical protein